MAKTSVTIGIPALNEEANIGQLLKSLLKQNESKFFIREIIVYSDGSTDRTVVETKKIKDQRIKLIVGRERKGNAARQNEIFKMAKGEVLVILNADILVKDKHFLAKMIKPILFDEADLVSPALRELPPRTYFEKVLSTSRLVKKRAYENFRDGINLLNCHGAARAFSKRLYQQISFPETAGEDAYSFLFCLHRNFRYLYLPETVCFFCLPDNFFDHCGQSLRYFSTKKIMEDYFPGDFVKHSFCFPKKLLLKSFSYYFFKKPIHCLIYIICLAFIKVRSLFFHQANRDWEIVKSSKAVYG